MLRLQTLRALQGALASAAGRPGNAAPLLADLAAAPRPAAGAWLLPALSAHTTAHTHYHGGRDGADGDGGAGGGGGGDSREEEIRRVERLRAAARAEANAAGPHAAAPGGAAPLPEGAARQAMLDPLGLLMAATSVPLGISLRLDRQRAGELGLAAAAHHQQRQEEQADAALAGGAEDHSSSHLQQAAAAAEEQQEQRQQRPRQEQGRRRAAPRTTAASVAAAAATAAHAPGIAGDAHTSAAVAAAARLASDPARALEQLEALIASARAGGGDQDSWGTTTQSAAEIAKHIAESNQAADAGGGGDGDGDGGSDGDGSESEDEGEAAEFSGPMLTPEQVGRDLKELDEVFAILAQVPWLDDGSLDERELRGVVAVGLLGTLEEVGWELREGVAAIWGGERDGDALAARARDPKQAAALASVLFHTKQLEAEYGAPPPASVQAAVRAAEEGADPVALQQRAEQVAQQQRLDEAQGRRKP